MKRFKVYVITGRKIKRAVMAVLALSAAVCTGVAIKHKAPEAVTAFSVADTDISNAILDNGMPREDEPFDLKGFITAVLGFDIDEPETIIESSSALFESAANTTPLPTAEPAATAEPTAEPTEEIPETSGDIQLAELPSHEQIISAKGLKMNNDTSYSVDLDALCAQPLDTVISQSAEPEVLIFHTHTTECYIGDEMSGESERTTNENYNVCAVGDVICSTLEGYGIHTVHDKTIHDYPSYQGSYTRSLNTITADIQKYPSVKVVIDIHRDAYVYADGSKLRVAAKVNGSDAAQAMLVLGTDSMGLYHPYWQSNLALAAKIQNAADIMYPDLMRPINLRRERFNMHVTKGSLLIEVGSNGNTLSEAKASAVYIGEAIAAALLNG